MTTHLPSSTAGLAAIRYRLGGPDTTEGGAWWCSYGTRHAINENCDCAPENVLAVAFPHHPLMDDWAAENDIYAAYRRNGGRIVLYAGEPQRAPVVQHGPFVAGSLQEIAALHQAYRAGTFTSMSALAEAARLASATEQLASRSLSPDRLAPATSTP